MKKIIKRIVCSLLALVTVMSVSTITVFAEDLYTTKIFDLSDDELYEKTWSVLLKGFDFNNIRNNPEDTYNTLGLSIYSSELPDFLEKNYSDRGLTDNINEKFSVEIKDVVESFNDYIDKTIYMEESTDVTDTKETDGKLVKYSLITNEVKYYWIYDEATNKYVQKDSKDKTIRSYEKYYVAPAETTESSELSDTSMSELASNILSSSNVATASGSGSGMVSPENNTPVTALESQTDMVYPDNTDNGISNTQATILIILGLAVIAGIIVIIVMISKKKGKKNN